MIALFANQTVRRQTLAILFLVLSGAMLVSCQSVLFTYKGARIAQVNLIPLTEGGLKSDHFETEDVTIDYEYTRSGNSLRLGGEISYSRALQNSFTSVPEFYIRVFFADAQGTVLAYRGIIASGYGYTSDRMRFHELVVLPPGTAFMAFGYSGRAFDGSAQDRTEKSFWFDPIAH
jgi:hypothetical protein